jgi:hypothetical protein
MQRSIILKAGEVELNVPLYGPVLRHQNPAMPTSSTRKAEYFPRAASVLFMKQKKVK